MVIPPALVSAANDAAVRTRFGGLRQRQAPGMTAGTHRRRSPAWASGAEHRVQHAAGTNELRPPRAVARYRL